jgi:hypothetical protein
MIRLALLGVLLVGSVSACSPAVKMHPSSIVQLGFAGIVNCASSPGQGRVLNSRQMSDGTLRPFSIPDGQVLVIERMTVSGSTPPATAAANVAIHLVIGGLFAWQGYYAQVIGSDGIGRFTANPTFSPGIVVKPGVEICVQTGTGSGGGQGNDVPTSILADGYLATDN